jgi:hypothetical protein
MATVDKTKSSAPAKKQSKQTTSAPEPKRLSKYALWRIENPGGIGKVLDWRAVNK